MAKVYAFPQKRKLPKGIEADINRVAREYIEVLYATMVVIDAIEEDKPTYEEVLEMVCAAFNEGIESAIEDLEES